MTFFPTETYWPFYTFFTLFILAVLLLDLGVFHKKCHEVSVKEASIWTAVWISLGLAFNVFFYYYALYKFNSDPTFFAQYGIDAAAAAKQSGLEFFTGYIVEKTLAVDNIFIFAMVFSYFSIPKMYQHRILFYGILGALLFRAIFIALGSFLMQFHWVVIFFGAVLMLTGIKMFLAPSKQVDPEANILIRILKKIFRISPQIEGEKFFVKIDGLRYATPLFIALVFIELSDIIFAVDSVPAIFGITKEPLIVYTSNIFAILGLRSMYFMLAGVMDKFKFIRFGLAAVLIFVGFKMVYLNEAFGGKFPISWSLAIIVGLIGSSIVASLLINPKKEVS